MSAESEVPTLSIGAVLGDYNAENKAWVQSIRTLGNQVMALVEGVASPLRVNVVFHVDEKLAPNEFTGVRTSRFSKKDAHLMVQAAVPSGPAADRRTVLLALLDAAIDEAEEFARKRRIAVDLGDIRSVIESLPTE